jgi:hypothetical protein
MFETIRPSQTLGLLKEFKVPKMPIVNGLPILNS